MKKITILAVASLAATLLEGATVESVVTHQQWPWSTDIKVEYRLAGLTVPVNLTVRAFDGETEFDVQKLRAAITGKLFGIDATEGSFTIDPAQAFDVDTATIDNFKVKIELTDAPESTEALYRIYNISNGKCTDITRAEILNGDYGAYETDFSKVGPGFSTPLEDVLVWTGVTNYPGIYTTNIVMRKIAAKDKVWIMGDADDAIKDKIGKKSRYYVKLTEDFYIGVFELTQYQYAMMDAYGVAGYLHTDDPDKRYPADGLYRYRLHSHPTSGAGLVTGEIVAWPTNSYLHDVKSDSALAWLRKKTKVEFDLPTAAQWEFACRAGTTNSLYSGKYHGKQSDACQANAEELGWLSANSGGTTHLGGQKPANAFGLYDMQGNVAEYVQNLSWAQGNPDSGDGTSAETPLVNPKGSSDVAKYDTTARVICGVSYATNPGSWLDARSAAYSAFYHWTAGGATYSYLGARLVCPATDDGQWAEHPKK